MIRRHLPLLVAAGTLAIAAGNAAAQAPGRNSGKEYALKNTSAFNAPPADARNPFWPIGWLPTAPVSVAQAAAPVTELKAEQFTVTSISIDSAGALAVINGQVKAVGERLPVPGATAGSQDFLTVKRIADGMVTLDYKGRELVIGASSSAPKKKP